MSPGDVIRRNHVQQIGRGPRALLLAHGFGCDQNMWRFVMPDLENDFRVVLFDYVGSGNSDLSAYSASRYGTLDGYAQDILDICDALALGPVCFAGHSVSSMIGLLAALQRPALFERLVMICPSPCFMNDGDYHGGFERSDLEELMNLLQLNYVGWANYLAPLVIGSEAPGHLLGELTGSLSATDPVVSKNFARATFFADLRSQLPKVRHPSLILQSQRDSLTPLGVGRYMHAQMPGSEYEEINASGHCLHMTDAQAILPHIRRFLAC